MTERLSTLLHDEARRIDVPPAPAARVIAHGRAIRRRRTSGVVAGAVAAVLAAVGVTVAVQHSSGDDSIQPAEQRAYVERGAWAVGDEVHVGDHVVTIPGLTSLHYTSLGALAWVQHPGKDLASTRSESLLITPDGTVHTIDAPGLDRVAFHPPATDPTSSLLTYTRAADEPGRAELMVLDLSSGQATVAGKPFRVQLEPNTVPTSLAGHFAVVQPGAGRFLLDLRTGARRPVPGGLVTAIGYAGGREVVTDVSARRWQVASDADGTVLLDVRYAGPDSESESPSLSPDGRYFAVPTGESGIRVYSVDTGTSVEFGGDRDVSDYGWTPDGHLVGKPLATSDSEVEVCDPDTGRCEGTGVTVGSELTLVRGADGLPV